MADLSFVRKEIIPQRAAPLSQTGIIGWFRKNMFSNFHSGKHITMGVFSHMEFSILN